MYQQFLQAEEKAFVYDIHIETTYSYYVKNGLADGSEFKRIISENNLYKTTVTFNKGLSYETLLDLKQHIQNIYKPHIKSIDCYVEYARCKLVVFSKENPCNPPHP
jgi:hypothetical protein